MANKEIWLQRVKEWRASGQGADEFCAGKGFSASLLRHWAWRLGLTRRRRKTNDVGRRGSPQLARVVRIDSPPIVRGDAATIAIEMACLRVVVRAGVDEATLATVMKVLGARSS